MGEHSKDEAQFNCKPELAEQVGGLFVRAIETAGRHFGLPCPVTGEFKIGQTWAETH